MILIAYDGTDSADRAITVAAGLLGGGKARVVHVWQPIAAPQDAAAFLAVAEVVDEDIERQEKEAREVAEAGALYARAAGFDADAEIIRGDGLPADALEAEVERLKPDLVVLGSRGLTGLKAMLKGSVSHHVGAHAHAPVLIIPPVDEAA
jgi:nucleotide-binding universal stress UspA family protein